MDIELKGITLDSYSERKGQWDAWIRLEIYDKKKSVVIPELFYVYATSDPKALKKLEKDSKLDMTNKSMVIDGKLELIKVVDMVRSNFKKVQPKSWDEFYKQMEQHFIYDE